MVGGDGAGAGCWAFEVDCAVGTGLAGCVEPGVAVGVRDVVEVLCVIALIVVVVTGDVEVDLLGPEIGVLLVRMGMAFVVWNRGPCVHVCVW